MIEGAAYSLACEPDPELDKYLDDLIAKIAAAQEPDGYLYTARTFRTPAQMPARRASRPRGPTSASGTSSTTSATCTRRPWPTSRPPASARCWTWRSRTPTWSARDFRPGGRPTRPRPPGDRDRPGEALPRHRRGEVPRPGQVLPRPARHARRAHKLYGDYGQDHKPVVEQTEAVGHAVRAGYLYSGMADVAALTGDADYVAGHRPHLGERRRPEALPHRRHRRPRATARPSARTTSCPT